MPAPMRTAALPTGETVLMTAARTGNVEAVSVLLDAGATIDTAQISKGQTALMWAVAEGHRPVAELLGRAGCRHPRADPRRFHPAAVCGQTGRYRPGPSAARPGRRRQCGFR